MAWAYGDLNDVNVRKILGQGSERERDPTLAGGKYVIKSTIVTATAGPLDLQVKCYMRQGDLNFFIHPRI